MGANGDAPRGLSSTVNEAEVIPDRGGIGMKGVAGYALDPANAERLWDTSLELIDSEKGAS